MWSIIQSIISLFTRRPAQPKPQEVEAPALPEATEVPTEVPAAPEKAAKVGTIVNRDVRPRARPRLSGDVARQVAVRLIKENPNCVSAKVLKDCPVMVLAVRGYYRDTMGRLGLNDFNVYDDAAFLITPRGVSAWNWNCDPVKKGFNKDVGKNYAQLMPGVWPFREGPHRGRPGHFRQMTDDEAVAKDLAQYFLDARAEGEFTVRRVTGDDVGALESGYQAINIHPGTKTGTGSWGCQTTLPDQFPAFRDEAYAAIKESGQTWLPYILTEERLA